MWTVEAYRDTHIIAQEGTLGLRAGGQWTLSLPSSNKLVELTMACHDASTRNIILTIIIIIRPHRSNS